MEQYEVGKRIGRGNYGSVYVAKDKRNQRWYCLKMIMMEAHSEEEREKAQQEVEVLRGLDHPGIVRYHEHFVYEDQLCVVMHYCEGGDLSQHIKVRAKHEDFFQQHEVIDFFVQIVMVRRAARVIARRAHPPRRPRGGGRCRRCTMCTASVSCTAT